MAPIPLTYYLLLQIRGCKGFDGDFEVPEASSGAEPLKNPYKKLTNNNKVALAA